MVEITEELIRDTVIVLKAYRKGIDIAIKPTFGKKRRELNALRKDATYLIDSYEAEIGEVKLNK